MGISERDRGAIARRLRTAVDDLTGAAIARMESELAWFRDLAEADRGAIEVVAHNDLSGRYLKYL